MQNHKSVLERLSSIDIDNLTPLEAINLVSRIRDEISADKAPPAKDNGQAGKK